MYYRSLEQFLCYFLFQGLDEVSPINIYIYTGIYCISYNILVFNLEASCPC